MGHAANHQYSAGKNLMAIEQFTVFTEGDELYDDMLASIRLAKTSIVLESYIFEPDVIGVRFIDALIERASSGIKIRLHLDCFGSSSLLLSTEVERMATAGIELKWFNPWRWYKPHRFIRRNHRKLMVIDSRSVWLGGFNIHKENSLREFGKDRWLDTQIRIDGPLAEHAQVYFDRLWQGRRDWSPSFDMHTGSILVSNHNLLQRHQLRRMLAMKFYNARKQILLCTPYFMPDRFIQRQMVKAAKRGMDVRLLLPYITDSVLTQWVARATYSSLMASGIRVYEYKPRFLHAKMMIIDDDWCTVGSANLDFRSFFINFEINLVSTRSELVNRLQDIFIEDLELCREIDPDRWAHRRGLWWFYQAAGWVLRWIL